MYFHIKSRLLFLYFFFFSNVYAQHDFSLTNHIILAFDQALPPNYRTILNNSSTKIISSINSSLYLNGDCLLKKGDFVSIVNFVADTRANSLDNFASIPKNDEGVLMKWIQSDDGKINSLFQTGTWNNMLTVDAYGSRYSLLSGAKQSAIEVTKDGKIASHTYLVMITDDYYNGMDDVNKDLDHFLNNSYFGDNRAFVKNSYLKKCHKVNSNFSFTFLKESVIYGTYRAMLFDVLPNYSAALPVLLSYPSTYNLKRVRGGYEIDFDFSERKPDFTLEGFELSVADLLYKYKKGDKQHVNLFIPSQSVLGDSLDISLKGWFLQHDDVYNGHLFTPDDQSELSKSKDLLITERVFLPREATVFRVPLSDSFWIWYKDDAAKAAFMWEVVIIAIFIMIIIFLVVGLSTLYIRVAQRYKPNDKDIKILKMY